MSDRLMQRRAAYRLVRAALVRGDLVRPDQCSCCGLAPRRGRDGRSLIQAHHHAGYDRPLDVQWLCVDCHAKETPTRPGELNKNAKLSDQQVREIREWTGFVGAIAKRHGITKRYAFQIRAGEWRRN